ncbi:hypothetical protein M569_11546, partial [Genlisea aurea]
LIEEEEEEGEKKQQEGYNWVSKILRVNSIWTSGEKNPIPSAVDVNGEESELCAVDDDCGDEEIEFDRESFSKLLRKVPLEEARSYEKLSYLGYLAYSISQIKTESLLKHHGLRFITSSLEKKQQQASKSETKESSSSHGGSGSGSGDVVKPEERNPDGNNHRISVSIAYQIAASAASYLHSHTKTILRFGDSSHGNDDMASIIATDSVTAVVAAKEEVKQAVADDLNSTKSSPCDWFVCDDDRTATRFFVIQGSESLASWQANLLFEPVPFEGLDVLIHRGIYEAAKGMYELMLPLICSHLKRFGKGAKFRFTGHSLGGSLSLVINLMLLVRGVVPQNSGGGGGLLPVIAFGSPSVMCGGDRLLRKLGLPRSHVRSVTMHRDIVPRAFSCSYPKHVAEFLKAVNGNFRTLPCLNHQKHLYGHMGEFLILQPDSRISPSHDLLPSGSGFYLLTCPEPEGSDPDKTIHVARSAFMNSPHPLEILSDRSAYGSGGTIHRDHDMITYLKSVRNVIRKELNRLRRERRNRRAAWMVMRRKGGELLSLSGVMIRSGGENLKKLRKLVTSGNLHLIVVLLIPAKLLILGMYNLVKF